MYNNGLISLDEYNDKSSEYRKEIRSATSDVKDYQDSLVSLYTDALKAEVDALDKVIDKRREAYKQQREYADYQKKVNSQQKDVNSIKAQIQAMENSSDAATLARVKKLKQDLADAEDDLNTTKQDHKDDLIDQGFQKMSDDLNQMLEDTEYEISHNADKQNEIIQSMLNKQVGMYQEAYSKINSIIKNTGWVGSNDFNNSQSQMSSQTGAQNQASNASQSQQTANRNNNISDGYYKHLYPVTENQYERLTELQEQSSEPLSEDVIMDVINAVEYKQEGWNPWDYHRGLCGVGYSGMKMNTEMRHSVSYYKWKNMVQRCYDKKIHKKYKPEYKDKSVCEEWLNYSNFRIWFDEHYVPYKNNQIDLDKDLLVQGNKVYSPETCVFLLHYQNTMFERSAKDKIYEKEDGTFVIGGGKKKTYATLKEAEDIVCERNQNRIESVAEKCKGSIPMCAYEAMLNWDVRLAMCS